MIRNLIKGISISLVCAAVYATAENKSAMNGVYLKAGAGTMKYNRFRATEEGYGKQNLRAAPVYNVAVGYHLTDAIRTDLNFQYGEIRYRHSEQEITLRQRIRTQALLINGYYDFHIHNSIVPYLTAGVGVGHNRAENLRTSDEATAIPVAERRGRNTTNLVWNVGAGAQYKLNKNFALDVAYKYMDLGFIKTNDVNDPVVGSLRGGTQKIRGHQLVGSLVYNF